MLLLPVHVLMDMFVGVQITTKVRKVPKQPVEVLINSFRQLPNINADNVRQLPCAADDDATAHHRNNSSSSTSSSSSEHPDETGGKSVLLLRLVFRASSLLLNFP